MPEELNAVAFRIFALYWRTKLPGVNCGPSCRRERCRGCREVEQRIYRKIPAVTLGRAPRADGPPFLQFPSRRHTLGFEGGRELYEWRISYNCGSQCAGDECRGCSAANTPDMTTRLRWDAMFTAPGLREAARKKAKAAQKRKGVEDLERVQMQWARWQSLRPPALAGFDPAE